MSKSAKPKTKPESSAKLLGQLAGSAAAIPAAACVFAVAAVAGVPLSTAVTRSVVAGVIMWLVLAVACRLLFTFLIRDWEQKTARQYQALTETPVETAEPEGAE